MNHAITKPHVYPEWYQDARNAFEIQFALYLDRLGDSKLGSIATEALKPGRRIRPTLFYSFWHAQKKSYPNDIDSLPAIAIELFHAASIIIDDIIDQEERRRNKLPFHYRYDLNIALLASHYLVAEAYHSLEPHPLAEKLFSAATLCYRRAGQGELWDTNRDIEFSVAEQQTRSLDKTVAFFQFVGRSLDICLNQAAAHYEAIFSMLGKNFQISNDVTDLIFLNESNRYDPDHSYRINLSFLMPLLLEKSIIKEDEIFQSVPYKRLIELSRAARNEIGDSKAYLHHLFEPERILVKGSPLSPPEQSLVMKFLDNLEQPSFWLHAHSTK